MITKPENSPDTKLGAATKKEQHPPFKIEFGQVFINASLIGESQILVENKNHHRIEVLENELRELKELIARIVGEEKSSSPSWESKLCSLKNIHDAGHHSAFLSVGVPTESR